MARIDRIALCAALLCAAGAARADVHWYLSGSFDDGATLTGDFLINQYGFVDGATLVTSDGSAFVGRVYLSPGDPLNNDAFMLDFGPNSYVDGMVLRFQGDLNVGTLNNPLLTSSYECRTNYCAPGTSTFRYIVSGYASTAPISSAVPEPASWSLMIAGFAVAGAAMRRARPALAA